jgi:hypothetical protein
LRLPDRAAQLEQTSVPQHGERLGSDLRRTLKLALRISSSALLSISVCQGGVGAHWKTTSCQTPKY